MSTAASDDIWLDNDQAEDIHESEVLITYHFVTNFSVYRGGAY